MAQTGDEKDSLQSHGTDDIYLCADRSTSGAVGDPDQAPAGHPESEHNLSGARQDEDTMLKERHRRDLDPERKMYEETQDKFRSSNKCDNWKDASQGATGIVARPEVGHVNTHTPGSTSASFSNLVVSNQFPAIRLQTPTAIPAVRGQHGASYSAQQSGSASSQSQQPVQTQQQQQLQQRPQPQPHQQQQGSTQPQPQPQPQSQSQPDQQSGLQSVGPPTAEDGKTSNENRETEKEQKTDTGDPKADKSEGNTIGKPKTDPPDGKTETEKEQKTDTDDPKTDKAGEKRKVKPQTEPPTEADREREVRARESVTKCITSVSILLEYKGDTPDETSIKEHLIHEMSPAQTHSSIMKGIHGLAVHVLRLEDWRIKKLMTAHVPGSDVHDLGVRNVVKEMDAHGKTVGDIVQYFTHEHSKRLDIVKLIEKIHKGCPYCDTIYSRVI